MCVMEQHDSGSEREPIAHKLVYKASIHCFIHGCYRQLYYLMHDVKFRLCILLEPHSVSANYSSCTSQSCLFTELLME